MRSVSFFTTSAAVFALCNAANAQIVGALPDEVETEAPTTIEAAPADASAPMQSNASPEQRTQPETAASKNTPDAVTDDLATAQEASNETPSEEINEDEIADKLNSMQQLQQSVTLTRSINGEVAETEKRTITYSRKNPVRATEAGQTKLEALKAAFDSQVLTRPEALEEAKLDFILADKNRDGAMSADEFISLTETWRENNKRFVEAPSEEVARDRGYNAFLQEIDPEAAEKEAADKAGRKFAFMAGAAQTVSQKDYIAEYLIDFDAMDENKDTLLKAEELVRFRAANRGDTMRTPAPVESVETTSSAPETEQ